MKNSRIVIVMTALVVATVSFVLIECGIMRDRPLSDAASAPVKGEPELPTQPPTAPVATQTLPHGDGKPNRLANEKSIYLLEHSRNPVDWFPWGEEAFAEALRLNRPILLSIGYSACHWCHLMLEESYSDDEVAALLNSIFVSIKVDREERPDLDAIYMRACQVMIGQCGWPLHIVMTPDGKPFFSATYMPKLSDAHGMGIVDMARKADELWKNKNAEVIEMSGEIAKAIENNETPPALDEPSGADALDKIYESLAADFDAHNGGFGRARKIPDGNKLQFLLRSHFRTRNPDALSMVERTLDAIRRGGIFDQVGFGVHRYAVDPEWKTPHFEKMLFDQALTASAFIEAWQSTGKSEYRVAAMEIFVYALREMRSERGLFFTSQDADQNGVEGGYYTWTDAEYRAAVGAENADLLARVFDVKPAGRNALRISEPVEMLARNAGISPAELRELIENARKKLFDARSKRTAPRTDTKVLVDINGLTISALAKGAAAFEDKRLADAAVRAADALLAAAASPEGRLAHVAGSTAPGFLDDYAFLVMGLIDLYEATFDVKYLKAALKINAYMMEHFADGKNGGLYFTSDEDRRTMRIKEFKDGATPSGNSVAFMNMLRLARITGDRDLESRARALEKTIAAVASASPADHAFFYAAVDFMIGPTYEVVVAGDPESDMAREMLRALRTKHLPRKVVLSRPPGDAPAISELAKFTKYQIPIGGKATAYVCVNNACKTPSKSVAEMLDIMGAK